MNDNLAPVFLDNKPVSLKDPKPKLSAILSASGRPETTDVKWLQFQPHSAGKSVRSEEVLDRTTDPSKPIYLTSAKGLWSGSQGAQGAKKEGDAGFTPNIAPAFGAGKGNSPTAAKTSDIKQSQVQSDDKQSMAQTAQQDDSGMQDDAEAGGESESETKDDKSEE